MGEWTQILREVFISAAMVSVSITIVLVLKSIKDYSHGGPQLRSVINQHYKGYIIFSVSRLSVAIWLILFFLTLPGIAASINLMILNGQEIQRAALVSGGVISVSALVM